MSRQSAIAFSAALIGSGVLAWALAGPPIITNPDLATPLNALGINRSPYGEVLAMALQGPIDTFFDAGMSGGAPAPVESPADTSPNPSRIDRFETYLIALDQASTTRTNPTPGSEALKRHLRRQAEDKLRFAYQLDPAHYANYNSLHFFLTEPAVGTHPELTPSAAKLAQDTIQYCLQQDQDPRPALTAAAATTNILGLILNDPNHLQSQATTAQMRQYLILLDHCLSRYDHLAQIWERAQQWERLSPQRIAECQERRQFIAKIRDAMNQSILHLEQQSHAPQATS